MSSAVSRISTIKPDGAAAKPDGAASKPDDAAALPADGRSIDSLVPLAKDLGDRMRAFFLRDLHQDSYAVGELCELF